jgi:cytosine deaminase
MARGFAAVPDGDTFWLRRAGVSRALLADPVAGAVADPEGLVRVDLQIAGGRVAAIAAAGSAPAGVPAVDLDGGQVWPAFVDMHAHLDKGHVWPRRPNPDGTLESARRAAIEDRERAWTGEDLRCRMDFGLRCAYAHGTAALRTHLDSAPGVAETTWTAFGKLRGRWAGRVTLQGVALAPIALYEDEAAARALADRVAEHRGILGAATTSLHPDMDALLDRVFTLAAARDLDLDFHADEWLHPEAASLRRIAEATLRHRYHGRVVCGHCCAVAAQPEEVVTRALDLAAEAELSIVSLPMCNLYLQDRRPGRTPRQRGVTLLHELKARGVRVAVASDNCRDPFYAFGDHDMLEVFSQAVRIAHLDRPYADWPRVVTAAPAAAMGLDVRAGMIAAGADADLVLFRGRGFSELLSRPQADRVVLRRGQPIDTDPPDYRELDALVTGPDRES